MRVTRTPNVAGSLALSGVNSLICAVALLLGYTGLSPWWGALVIWTISPPLLLFAGAYLIRDVLHSQTRKQALLALALFILVAIVDWNFRITGI
jgi:hypothetical protein